MQTEYLFDEPNFDNFASALRCYRGEHSVSLSKVALTLGRNPSYLSRLESEERATPSLQLVIGIIFALSLTVPQSNALLFLRIQPPARPVKWYVEVTGGRC